MDNDSDSGASSGGSSSSDNSREPWNDPKNPKILTFRPTMEEFRDFMQYIKYMESRNAHLGGIAKIIPPKEWVPRKTGYEDLDDIEILSSIEQRVVKVGSRGAFEVRNYEKAPTTWGRYKRAAYDQDMDFSTSDEETERNFWKHLLNQTPPVYGGDNSGSLFDEEQDVWNIASLPSVLDDIVDEDGNKIAVQGVNTPYLYFGMWRAFFGWHTEDMDLYSINYVHWGSSKFWYAIPPSSGRRFERIAESLFPDFYKTCHAFLRHKSVMISPSVLKNSGVPFNKIVQKEGEIIITFPFGYHAGFNGGLNIAESTNFATERWVEYGKFCSICNCQEENVRIDMGIFVKKYQPERWEAWQDGTERGRHPEEDKGSKNRPPTSGPAAEMAAKGKRRRHQGNVARKMMAVSIKDEDEDAIEEELSPRHSTRQAEKSAEKMGRLDALIRNRKPKRRYVDSDEEEAAQSASEKAARDWPARFVATSSAVEPNELAPLPPVSVSTSPYRHLLASGSLPERRDSPPQHACTNKTTRA